MLDATEVDTIEGATTVQIDEQGEVEPTPQAPMPAEMVTGYCEWHHKLFERITTRGTPYHFAGQNACDGEIIRTRDGEILYRREDIQGFEAAMATVAAVPEMPETKPGLMIDGAAMSERAAELRGDIGEPDGVLEMPFGAAVCQNCDKKPVLENSAYCSACEFEMFGDQQPPMMPISEEH